MWFEDFQAGRHGVQLGYRKGTSLAILNLHVLSKHWAQSDLESGSKCGLKIFKIAATAAILDIETERFLAISDASHQASVQSDF